MRRLSCVVYDPAVLPFARLLRLFWESHDPTQGMRQGNDVGAQYRSAIFAYSAAQLDEARASRAVYQDALAEHGFGSITTEIAPAPPFYYAEEEHQQYLAKNPDGYCGLGLRRCLLPNWDDGLESNRQTIGKRFGWSADALARIARERPGISCISSKPGSPR